jgi:hypothetical protein
MAEHNLFFGGARTPFNGFYQMLPSTPPNKNQDNPPTCHKSAGMFNLTRHLDWKEDDCPKTGASTGSAALCDYLTRNVIAEGDILNIVIMSRHHSLMSIWWMIKEPLTGFTFDLQIKGCANSLGGTEAAPVPILLAADVDGSMVATDPEGCNLPSGVIGIDPAAQGDPLAPGIYFDQNDMLQLVVKTLPPEGIHCSSICISPQVIDHCAGAY